MREDEAKFRIHWRTHSRLQHLVKSVPPRDPKTLNQEFRATTLKTGPPDMDVVADGVSVIFDRTGSDTGYPTDGEAHGCFPAGQAYLE